MFPLPKKLVEAIEAIPKFIKDWKRLKPVLRDLVDSRIILGDPPTDAHRAEKRARYFSALVKLRNILSEEVSD